MYKVLKFILRPIFYLLFGIKIIHKERLKYKGKMVLVANHRSNFDPVLMHFFVRQKVRFMAKAELFKNPLLRWLVTAFGAFPVERGRGDLGAIKNCFKILNKGGTVGIFPEGTRTRGDKMRSFQHGATMIALRTNTPILPIYLAGTLRPFRRTRIIVGEPIHLGEYLERRLSDPGMVKLGSYFLYYKMQQLQHEAEALCK